MLTAFYTHSKCSTASHRSEFLLILHLVYSFGLFVHFGLRKNQMRMMVWAKYLHCMCDFSRCKWSKTWAACCVMCMFAYRVWILDVYFVVKEIEDVRFRLVITKNALQYYVYEAKYSLWIHDIYIYVGFWKVWGIFGFDYSYMYFAFAYRIFDILCVIFLFGVWDGWTKRRV